MTSPALEIQGLIVARLKADSGVTALVAGRVYDTIPEGALFPYISMGPRDHLSDDADCVTGFEITLQIDVWSRAVGFPQAENIADAVRRSLREYEFPEMENPLVFFQHQQTRILRDPDPLTTHAAMTFEAFAEQP